MWLVGEECSRCSASSGVYIQSCWFEGIASIGAVVARGLLVVAGLGDLHRGREPLRGDGPCHHLNEGQTSKIHLHSQNLLHALEWNPFLVEILALEESLHLHLELSNLTHRFSLHPCEEGFLSLELNLFLEVNLFLGASHPSLEESHVLEENHLAMASLALKGSHVLEASGRPSILLCHLFLFHHLCLDL